MASPRPQILVLPDVEHVRTVSDVELVGLQGRLAEVRRVVDAASAVVAGEVARRSARELGYNGLAQRAGARTPENLVSRLAGVTGAEGRALVRAGAVLSGGMSWMSAVAGELASGALSVGAAAAIGQGLGEPTAEISVDDLAGAASRVLQASAGLPPEKVAACARQERDDLDEAGVADREALLRDKRYLRLIPHADGMTRIIGLLDPESAALVTDAIDCVTAPRRGGVRFVDPTEQARAGAIVNDSRTTDQLAVDALVHIIGMASALDDGTVFGVRGPAVRVHVTLADLDRRAGVGRIEGQTTAASIATVERQICTRGLVPILFDGDGSALNLGRQQRLFNTNQRTVITARDGGCLITACNRPPSWTETHHIDEWDKHHGRTDTADGVSLCRHHHMWIHNTGARIRRDGTRYRAEHADGRTDGRTDELVSKSPIRHTTAA